MSTPASHVLIVDDDQPLNRSLSSILGAEGYRISSRYSAAGLIDYLDRNPVDLIILDIGLPGVDGLSALDTIKRHEQHRDLPILVLSGSPPGEASVEALGLGAADFVTKPFRLDDFLARIRAHLRASQALTEARNQARSDTELISLITEVSAAATPAEIFTILVRRIATGLSISRCSIVLDDENGETATVVASSETPNLRHLTIDLRRYPELETAISSGAPLLCGDVRNDPLFASVRELWRVEGRTVPTTSVAVVPFQVRNRPAAFFLRTTGTDARLGDADLRFAARVMEAATPLIFRAYDFEEALRRQDEMKQLAETDPLTSLYNRRALRERLDRELARTQRQNTVLSCLMLDIDHFKRLNDTFGHELGDRVLIQLSDLLRREQRAMDVLARLGGEEFIVLLPETGIRGARIYAERILRKVNAATLGTPEYPVQITVSIGIATVPDERVTDSDSLLRLADANLLRAKADGRNRYRD
ncbi:MAG: diguanylate cyclase [Gemmatimonadales bacterium]|nr:diguanylate cyclase [Gemmatimonadales bacterium]